MYSDKSFYEIVKILISNNDGISISKIASKLSKSRSVVYYNIEKINDQFALKNVDKIINNKNGIILDKKQKDVLELILKDLEYIFNKNERRLILCLFVITYPKRQSIAEYVEMFKTSRNSIIGDILYIKKEILRFNKDIRIEYNSKNGYYLEGDELIQVQYLYRLIKKITKLNNPKLNSFILSKYRDTDKIFSEDFKKNLMEKMSYIQKRLGKTMSDRAIENYAFSIPYIFLFSKKTRGSSIVKKLNSIKERLEYKVIDEICILFENEYRVEIKEKMKLLSSLILLCTRKITDLHNLSKDYKYYYDLAKKLIDDFELKSKYVIYDKKDCIDNLVTYFKVMYFRNKYNIISKDLNYEKIIGEYRNIYDVVKHILKKEKLKFSDYDKANITMQILLYIEKKKKRVLIVCKEEEIIKKNMVKKILDYISAIEIVDVVDKVENIYHNIDLVISTQMDINTNVKTVLVDSILTKNDINRIFEKITELDN